MLRAADKEVVDASVSESFPLAAEIRRPATVIKRDALAAAANWDYAPNLPTSSCDR